jgi:hypothetical protein
VVLPTIARLSSLLTLVINKFTTFTTYIKYCSEAEDPLLRDLAKRIVYEPYEPYKPERSGWDYDISYDVT